MPQTTPRTPLRRCRQGRILGGVCTGLARRWGWRLSLVRVLFLVATLIPVLPGLPLYLILWLLVPLEDDSGSGQAGEQRDPPAPAADTRGS